MERFINPFSDFGFKKIFGQGEKGSNWRFKIHAVYGVFFMNFCFNETSKFH